MGVQRICLFLDGCGAGLQRPLVAAYITSAPLYHYMVLTDEAAPVLVWGMSSGILIHSAAEKPWTQAG